MSILPTRIPDSLFKYYSFDEKYNADRLSGKVFMANPNKFNDPIDCKLGINNNFSEIGRDENWLKLKLEELGLDPNDYKKIVDDDRKFVDTVWKTQLEKVGILCLSQVPKNKLFWGYYTNNEGYCVEFDSKKIVARMAMAYVNSLDFNTTMFLANEKQYFDDPYSRNKTIPGEVEDALILISRDTALKTSNQYLRSKILDGMGDEVYNFVINAMLKRLGGHLIEYKGKVEIGGEKAQLFYNGEDDKVLPKYYTKTREWEPEKEFRLIASLGGNKVFDLGKDIVKSIRFGCNISVSKMVTLLNILKQNGMESVPLYLMKSEPGEIELEAKLLDSKKLFDYLGRMEKCIFE